MLLLERALIVLSFSFLGHCFNSSLFALVFFVNDLLAVDLAVVYQDVLEALKELGSHLLHLS